MRIDLYAFKKRHNSTRQPSGSDRLASVEVTLKNNTNYNNPSFILKSPEPWYKCNYVKWNNNFYFVDSMDILTNETCALNCSIDCLATYKEAIKDPNQKFFVQYSQYYGDSSLVDNRLSTSVYVNRPSRVDLNLYGDAIDSVGLYVVQLASYPTTASVANEVSGGTTACMLKREQLRNLVMNLNDNSNIVDAIKRTLTDAANVVTKCMWVPFTEHGNESVPVVVKGSSTQYNLCSNGYSLPYTSGHAFCRRYSGYLDLTDWNRYGDFRDCEPYTTFNLFLPFYGYIDLQPSMLLQDEDITSYQRLHIVAMCDFLSGMVTYSVGSLGTYTAKFGVDIAVASSQTNYLQALGGLVSTAGAVATGNYVGATNALFNSVVTGASSSVGTSGSYGNRSTVAMSATPSGTFTQNAMVHLQIYRHNTSVTPGSVASTIGIPTFKSMTLNGCDGYIQTMNANIQIDAPDFCRTEINRMLDEGIILT